MKIKATQVKTHDGSDFVPAGITKVRPLIVEAVRQTMLIYGVKKFDVGFMPFGSVTTYVPKVGDIEGLPPRPAVLDQAIREVFRNLAPVLFIHGIMTVELTDLTEEELKQLAELWKEVANG